MKNVIISIYILSSVLLCSNCNNKDPKGITKNIPRNPDGSYVKGYYYLKELYKKLHLEPIENGFDSMMIRLWYTPSLEDSVIFVDLAKRKGDSRLFTNVSKFRLFFNQNHLEIDSVSGVNKEKIINNASLLYDVVDLGLLTIPGMDSSKKELGPTADPGMLGVEYSTKSNYRYYRLLSPLALYKWGKNDAAMNEIMLLLERSLDFKW